MNTKQKLNFSSDYTRSAHPAILRRLAETAGTSMPGYGTDPVCDSAKDKIRSACKCPHAEVFFLTGGTQMNATVIDSILRSYQGVIAADTGHISVHEAGAIEFGGHKVLTIPATKATAPDDNHRPLANETAAPNNTDKTLANETATPDNMTQTRPAPGKLRPADLAQYVDTFMNDANHDHMVMPGLVYISQPTEYGTLYTLDELTQLSEICHANALSLYVDGARLAYALASPANDVTLADLARLCDAFYIGGTKCGALFGEALVIPQQNFIPHFFTIMKQHGALLAKGWLLGLQFDVLFTDDLYEKIGQTALNFATEIQDAIEKSGFPLYFKSPTNQLFVVLDDRQRESLESEIDMSFWEQLDENHVVMRIATSWSTTREDVDALLKILKAACN